MKILFVASPKMETKADWANLSPGVDIQFIGGIQGISKYMDMNGGASSFDKCIVLPEKYLIAIKDEKERHSTYLRMLDELRGMIKDRFSAQATIVVCVDASSGEEVAERLVEVLNNNMAIISVPSVSNSTFQKLAKLDLLTLVKTYKSYDYAYLVNKKGENIVEQEKARETMDLGDLQKEYSSDDVSSDFGSMTLGEDSSGDEGGGLSLGSDSLGLGDGSGIGADFDDAFKGADGFGDFGDWSEPPANQGFGFGNDGDLFGKSSGDPFSDALGMSESDNGGQQQATEESKKEPEVTPVDYTPQKKKFGLPIGKINHAGKDDKKSAKKEKEGKVGLPVFGGQKSAPKNASAAESSEPASTEKKKFSFKKESTPAPKATTTNRFAIDIEKETGIPSVDASESQEEIQETSGNGIYFDGSDSMNSQRDSFENDDSANQDANDSAEDLFAMNPEMSRQDRLDSLVEGDEISSGADLFSMDSGSSESNSQNLFDVPSNKASNKGEGNGLTGITATNSRQKANYKALRKGKAMMQEDRGVDLQAALEPYMKRGGLFVFTGSANTGKTVVASNIANLLCNMGYRVCILDLDMDGKGMSYINTDTYRIVHSGNQVKNNTLQVLNSTGTDFMKWADVIREGMYIITSTLSSDVDIITDQLKTKDHSYERLIKQLTLNFNFVIVDVDFLNLVRYYHPFINTADLIIDVEEATQKGMTNFLLHMSNIPDEDIENLLYTRLVLVLNKYDGMRSLFGEKVSNTASMLSILDNAYERLAQSTSDYSFTDIPIASILNYSSEYEKYWFSKKYLTDTEEGRKIFTDMLLNGLKST